MNQYSFNTAINRFNTNSLKWDFAEEIFKVKDVLPMWVADMDFRAPQPIIDAVMKVSQHGIFGYSKVQPSYYEALIEWMKDHHNWEIKKEWVTSSPGGVPALHIFIKEFTNPGDQVIVQTPVYYPFFSAIKSANCEMLDNPLRFKDNRYTMDLTDLKRKINSRTKLIILCNPHNPVGRVWSEAELKEVGELCVRNNIFVVSDEIHQDIVFDGFKHIPFASISDQFTDNSITITGISKSFNLAGLQMSNIIISNTSIRKRFRKAAESCGLFLPNIFAIAATEAAYQSGAPWLKQLLKYLKENLVFLNDYVTKKIPGLRVIQPEGTYLVWLDFRDCGIDPSRLGQFVREEAKVALDAGTKFGCKEEGFERMNIACPRTTLLEGLRRIEEAVRAARKR
jgi:cystathionine beta-lyase